MFLYEYAWLPSRALARACGARLMEYVVWKNALRAFFHTTYSIVCAAKLREYPARESEGSENQIHSIVWGADDCGKRRRTFSLPVLIQAIVRHSALVSKPLQSVLVMLYSIGTCRGDHVLDQSLPRSIGELQRRSPFWGML